MELFCLAFEIFLVVAHDLKSNKDFKKIDWPGETKSFLLVWLVLKSGIEVQH